MNSENPLDLAIAPEVFFTVWLNLWRNKAVSLTDVAYAGGELFGTDGVSNVGSCSSWLDWLTNLAPSTHPYILAWPTIGDSAGLPTSIAGPAIAISTDSVLSNARLIHTPTHRVQNEATKFALARQSSKVSEVLELAQRELTSGDRTAMESLLSQVATARLPLQAAGSIRRSLETSSTIRAIGLLALTHTEVVSSRSTNERLRQHLKELVRSCELAMCAVVSNI